MYSLRRIAHIPWDSLSSPENTGARYLHCTHSDPNSLSHRSSVDQDHTPSSWKGSKVSGWSLPFSSAQCTSSGSVELQLHCTPRAHSEQVMSEYTVISYPNRRSILEGYPSQGALSQLRSTRSDSVVRGGQEGAQQHLPSLEGGVCSIGCYGCSKQGSIRSTGQSYNTTQYIQLLVIVSQLETFHHRLARVLQ